MIDTKKLRKLAQAATPGCWYVERGNYVYGCKEVTDGEEEWHPVIACTDDDEVNVSFEANASFIAAANPATINELLDRLEAAEKEIESWKGLSKQFSNEADALRARIEAMERLEQIEAAAQNLVKMKGRHNTEIAYRRLVAALEESK